LTELASALKQSEVRLLQGTDTPRLDAQVLLAHILGRPRAWILAHPEFELSRTDLNSLESALGSLDSGVPLAHVIGRWEFFGLEFNVTPGTLIPRPETELLVEVALDWLKLHESRRLAVDVGTGSGCIAVALAVHIPDLTFIASDISSQAVRAARRNSLRHKVDSRVHCVQANLLPPLSPSIDLLCANLPYIPSDYLPRLEIYGKEPTQALDGGVDGLREIRELMSSAPPHVAPGGLILFEIESSNGGPALYLAQRNFPDAKIELFSDLAGLDRLIAIHV
jgi:release factor glutamine methyltransferase